MRVGTLSNISGDYNVFAFEPEYVDDSMRPTLSQSFLDVDANLIRVVPRTHIVAPPFFSNLLPEPGTLLRSIIARQQGIKNARDFPFVRALGTDLPGAVIVTELMPSAGDAPSFERSADDEPPLRFSLAGAGLKFSASLFDDRFSIADYAGGDAWIVKLPTNAYPRLPENEYAMMTLGAAIGLAVPDIALRSLDAVSGLPKHLPTLRRDERYAYAIRRFDRRVAEPRLQVEDFNQIAAQKPDEKYERRSSSYVANVISQLCGPEDVDEFVRRLVFGVCIGNDDMHLKNWAVTYPDGRHARIAPMYDFVCTRQYFSDGDLALTIGGEREFERITLEVMRTFARQAEISAKRVTVLVDEVVEKLRAAWPSVRATVDSPDLVRAFEPHVKRVPLMRARMSTHRPAPARPQSR